MIDLWLEALSQQIQGNLWIAPLFAFLAGVLTSFTPCALSSIPLIIGYVGGTGEKTTKKAFRLSLTFVIGSAITFTILGIIATTLGRLIGTNSSWWYIFLGTLMMLMALQTFGLYEFIPSSYLVSKSTKKGYVGALIAGVFSGIFSSPCSTPVLIALLTIVAQKGNMLWGILLLLLYSVGHGLLAIVCGTSIGFTQKIAKNSKYGVISNVLKIALGIAMTLIGLYMFYLGL